MSDRRPLHVHRQFVKYREAVPDHVSSMSVKTSIHVFIIPAPTRCLIKRLPPAWVSLFAVVFAKPISEVTRETHPIYHICPRHHPPVCVMGGNLNPITMSCPKLSIPGIPESLAAEENRNLHGQYVHAHRLDVADNHPVYRVEDKRQPTAYIHPLRRGYLQERQVPMAEQLNDIHSFERVLLPEELAGLRTAKNQYMMKCREVPGGRYQRTISFPSIYGPPTHLHSENRGTRLVPQPTVSPEDPLNWSWWKKHAVLAALIPGCLLSDWTLTWGTTVFELQAPEWYARTILTIRMRGNQ